MYLRYEFFNLEVQGFPYNRIGSVSEYIRPITGIKAATEARQLTRRVTIAMAFYSLPFPFLLYLHL